MWTVLKKNVYVCATESVRQQIFHWGFPGGSAVKNLPACAGDMGSVPRLGRAPRVGNSNPLYYFCLGNPMDRGA